MSFQVSYCPYRTSVNDWSKISETPFSQPAVFTGGASDLNKLDDCNEELVREKEERAIDEAAAIEQAELEAAEGRYL